MYWLILNSDQFVERLWSSSRDQGNGLSKLQVVDYRNIDFLNFQRISRSVKQEINEVALKLIAGDAPLAQVKDKATNLVNGLV